MTDYKETLHLPKTDFPMRAGLAQKEPKMLERWENEDLYGTILKKREGAKKYILHDGPPYANGHLHHGHILNKLLKDFVVKYQIMQGHYAPYLPGWDCHGLPIEVQVDKELGAKKSEMSKVEVRKACRAYAERFVTIQKEEFKRLGVFGMWDSPYLTMNYPYEAQIIRELGKVMDSGLLYRGLRPVNWCMVHQTALAEAEVEYEDHRSPSIYVGMTLNEQPTGIDGRCDLVIWTTTPWTLPANLAVSLHPDFEYVGYQLPERVVVVAKELLSTFLHEVGEGEPDEAKMVGSWTGKELEGLTYQHPFLDRQGKVILGEHVTLEAGTGCVHTAPGHGPDDFAIGKKYDLEVLSPVNDKGILTEAAGPFADEHIFKANPKIVAQLKQSGHLVGSDHAMISHRYPHCWRCHKPIILRATEQWWVAMDKPYGKVGKTLREMALDGIEKVDWIPIWGKERIRGMLANRPDWCLSRQRSWGVPITVIYCTSCSKPVLGGHYADRIAKEVEKKGSDIWFEASIEELYGDIACEKCGGKEFRKEEDILDVWFDSGVSFAVATERRGLGNNGGEPIDLYLEGSDQHRGWFHSSLLCSLATRERPPYKAVLTHGFVVDGQGKKISKSKGNFVDPFKTISQNGAELLRLWVAFEDYREDIRISNEILTRLSDTYRKVRNTLRFLLGNLSDFDPQQHWVPFEKLENLDQYALARVQQSMDKIANAYATMEFHQVVHTMNDLCTVELSAFYLDILKDRLYASSKESQMRRSAQTVLHIVTGDLLRLLAPVLVFTTEEAWQYFPKWPDDESSVHMEVMPGVDEPSQVSELRKQVRKQTEPLLAQFSELREVRKQVNMELEEARRQKQVGSSVEAAVTLKNAPVALKKFSVAFLADFFIVSQVAIDFGGNNAEALRVVVEKADGTKCDRCWLYRNDVGQNPAYPGACARCTTALQEDDVKLSETP